MFRKFLVVLLVVAALLAVVHPLVAQSTTSFSWEVAWAQPQAGSVPLTTWTASADPAMNLWSTTVFGASPQAAFTVTLTANPFVRLFWAIDYKQAANSMMLAKNPTAQQFAGTSWSSSVCSQGPTFEWVESVEGRKLAVTNTSTQTLVLVVHHQEVVGLTEIGVGEVYSSTAVEGRNQYDLIDGRGFTCAQGWWLIDPPTPTPPSFKIFLPFVLR